MAAPSYSQATSAARDAALAALAQGGGAADAARAAITAADRYFDEVRRAVGLDAALARMACKAGCGWCCHQIVAITTAELSLLEQAIAALPPERRAAIAQLANDAMETGRGLDQRQWWASRIRCPLLGDDGLCVVHEARPLPCRAYNSADAEACRRSFEGEPVRAPVLAAQHGVYGHAQAGLAEALTQAGIVPGPLALAAGVATLFPAE
jgi:Fe-S-cluster containining protein